MLRAALILIGAVVLTFLLVSVARFVAVNTTLVGHLGLEAERSDAPPRELAREPKYSDLRESLERGLWVSRLAVKPLIACVIGAFVGSLAARRVGLLAALAGLPLGALAFDAERRDLEAAVWAAAYVAGTCGVALAVWAWRSRRRRLATA